MDIWQIQNLIHVENGNISYLKWSEETYLITVIGELLQLVLSWSGTGNWSLLYIFGWLI